MQCRLTVYAANKQCQASSRRVLGHLDLASHKKALAGDPVAVRQPCMVHADAKLQRVAQIGVLQHRQEGKTSGRHTELVLNTIQGHQGHTVRLCHMLTDLLYAVAACAAAAVSWEAQVK